MERTLLKPCWIICFDDIERLSKKIQIEDLLGYINELREEFKLKIVLIYNHEKMGEHNTGFSFYQEKVVDRALNFSPDIQYILSYVFADIRTINEDSDLIIELTRKCVVLNMKNIRLLVKTKRFYQEVLEYLPSEPDKAFINNILFSLLLFIWTKNTQSKNNVLNLKFLEKYSWLEYRIEDNNKLSNDEIEASKLLDDFNYTFTDDLDNILLEFINTDVLNHENLLTEYKKHTLNVSKGQLENSLRLVWKKYYHASFSVTENDFCNELISSASNFLDYITVNSLDGVISILVDLGRNKDADRLLVDFLGRRAKSLADYDEFPSHPVEHDGLKKAIDEAKKESQFDHRGIGEIIESCGDENLIEIKDRTRLAEFTTDDFYNYFTSTNGANLVVRFVKLGNLASKISNPDKFEIKIQATVREAAVKIASLNLLNKLRLVRLGLIEDEGLNDAPEKLKKTSTD